jgi:6-phosphofructokinase 1
MILDIFFYNGGGDSADTCLKISQLSESMGFPIQAIHIPKTVDNDLPVTDNCPGFGSVAKYIAVSTLEASLDVASMAASSTKIFVLEVMGRHAGWIAAAGGLVDSTIPIVILFPEIEFNEKAFLAKVDKNVKDYGYCTIVVSEGTKWPNGKFLAEQETRDDFGHAQLGGAAPVVANIVKKSLGYKFHWAVADYLQRSARHLASNEDVKQAYALGKAAVEMAIEGKNAIMPAIIRTSNNPYEWEIGYGELKDIANVEKMMPENYISKDGFSITNECREYLLPLIEGENYSPYNNGLPEYVVLKKSKVNKKLPPFKI